MGGVNSNFINFFTEKFKYIILTYIHTYTKKKGGRMEDLKQRIVELVKEKPHYGRILLRAIEVEENPPNKEVERLGWEWHNINAMPPHLTKLVGEGIVEITYKSRRYTHYRLTDRNKTKDALKELGLWSSY